MVSGSDREDKSHLARSKAQVEVRAGASWRIGLGGARMGADKFHVPAMFILQGSLRLYHSNRQDGP